MHLVIDDSRLYTLKRPDSFFLEVFAQTGNISYKDYVKIGLGGKALLKQAFPSDHHNAKQMYCAVLTPNTLMNKLDSKVFDPTRLESELELQV